METMKRLIITMALIGALAPTAHMYAMDALEERDEKEREEGTLSFAQALALKNTMAPLAQPLTPDEQSEMNQSLIHGFSVQLPSGMFGPQKNDRKAIEEGADIAVYLLKAIALNDVEMTKQCLEAAGQPHYKRCS